MSAPSAPLLAIEDLTRHFPVDPDIFGRPAAMVRAVDGVSFTLARGETLAIVGESGCGKTTLSRLVMRLIEPSAGAVHFAGEDLTQLSQRRLRTRRRRMQIIFQDPFAALDPRLTVRRMLAQPLALHAVVKPSEIEERSVELLRLVGLDAHHLDRYPHQFSGGQRQRLCIARALAPQPDMIVADEPVSALDVSVQAQIINLMRRLQATLGLSFLLVTHDLGVVRQLAQRVAVMYLGRIVELTSAEELFSQSRHPYTRALLHAVPRLDRRGVERDIVEGDVPSPISPPSGCHFHPRCPFAIERCRVETPPLERISTETKVACHRWREIPAWAAANAPVAPRQLSLRESRQRVFHEALTRSGASSITTG